MAKARKRRVRKLKPEDIVLSLWGVVLAFLVQVTYDTFGNEFWTSIMPKVYWGLVIAVVLAILLLYYIRRFLGLKSRLSLMRNSALNGSK